ncbi:MAG: leucine-rich repeat domain-containing protein [Oscillospiraceae bacterium]|nr:leucine-rich repeat domain-containing protein [Oscillospiraceae bacterium]
MKELRGGHIAAIIVIILLCLAVLGGAIFWHFFDSEASSVWQWGALRFRDLGMERVSQAFFARSVGRDSSNTGSWTASAQLYLDQKDYSSAERTLTEAISKNPDEAGLYTLLCMAYVDQDKLSDAVALLDGASPVATQALEPLRPDPPTASMPEGDYDRLITVSITGGGNGVCSCMNSDFPSVSGISESQTYHPGEGENTILALSISGDGLVSRLADFSYILTGVSRAVMFEDPATEAMIRSALGSERDVMVTTDDLATLTELTVPPASDGSALALGDLAKLSNLASLCVDGVTCSDWSFLESLTQLKKLHASGCSLTADDLAHLGGLTRLEELYLSDNLIGGIESLRGCVSLRVLDVSGNSVRRLDPLAGLTELRDLDLSYNAVTSIDPLEELVMLRRLDCSYLLISDISALTGKIRLEDFSFDYCSVTDLSPLGTCSALRRVSGRSNQIINLDALADCVSLSSIDFSRNNITDASGICGLDTLIYADLGTNYISQLPEGMTGMKRLSTLVISRNGISSLDPLAGMAALENLDLEYNSVSTLEPLSLCPSLKTVKAFGNAAALMIGNLEENGVIVYR